MADSDDKNDKKCKKWKQKYKDEYGKVYSFITKSSKSDEHAFCSICSIDISMAHGGINDIKQHMATIKHMTSAKLRGETKSITSYYGNDDLQVIRAEALMASAIVEHMLSFHQ
jgi:cystathionine beta-lyase/cystathionine gamma-synthase